MKKEQKDSVLAVKDAVCFCRSKSRLVMSGWAWLRGLGQFTSLCVSRGKMAPVSQTALSRGDYLYYMHLLLLLYETDSQTLYALSKHLLIKLIS